MVICLASAYAVYKFVYKSQDAEGGPLCSHRNLRLRPRRRGRASMKLVLTPAEPERHYTDNHAAAARRRRCTWVLIERHNGELIPGGYYIFRFRTRLGSKTAETVRSYLHTAATGRWRWRCSRMRMASHAAPTSSRNGGAGTTASSGTSVNAMWFVSGITRPTLRTLNRAAGRIEADQLGRTAGSRSQPQGLARESHRRCGRKARSMR